MRVYDCIVVGVGGVGSAALYHAARRGWVTLGLDRHVPGHDRGSSHGQSRIIRQAYFEHPNYVPLVLTAYRDWAELERESGRSLCRRTGLLQVGDPNGAVVQGLMRSASEHQLVLERLDAHEISTRFPYFEVPAGHCGLYEPAAGVLFVEECVRAFADQAVAAGAELATGQAVSGWAKTSEGIVVTTETDEFVTRRLILSTGAWSASMIGEDVSLKVLRKHQHWFETADSRLSADEGFPTFLFETDNGVYYGFPQLDACGLKIAEHSGGEDVSDPQLLSRELDLVDLDRVTAFALSHLKTGPLVHREHSVCMYTMTADGHFVVDLHPRDARVALACGLSGHGFKFVPLLGRYLVDLLEGERSEEMRFLQWAREPL